jgi:hypothetical protein
MTGLVASLGSPVRAFFGTGAQPRLRNATVELNPSDGKKKYIKKNTQCDTRIDTDSEYIKRLAVPGTLARSNQGLFRADPIPWQHPKAIHGKRISSPAAPDE